MATSTGSAHTAIFRIICSKTVSSARCFDLQESYSRRLGDPVIPACFWPESLAWTLDGNIRDDAMGKDQKLFLPPRSLS